MFRKKRVLLEVIDEKMDFIIATYLGEEIPDRVKSEYFYLKTLYNETVKEMCEEVAA